ncbi:hypothetical protein BGZ65_007412, partial [Modicella reniformis]
MTVLDQTAAVLGLAGDESVGDLPNGSLATSDEKQVSHTTRKTRQARKDSKGVSSSENENDDNDQEYWTADEQYDERESNPRDEAEEEVGGDDYEAQRQRNIQRNQQLLLELGLNSISTRREYQPAIKPSKLNKEKSIDDDEYTEEDSFTTTSTRKRRVWRVTSTIQSMETRSSKRIRGEPAKEYSVDVEAIENGLRYDLDEDYRKVPSSAPPEDQGFHSKVNRWRGRKQTTGYIIEVDISDAGVPITL